VTRKFKIIVAILAVAVVIGLISFRSLRQRVNRLAESQKAEEKARLDVLAPPISTPTDVLVTAKIFWAAGPDKVAPVEIQLPLSADPIQRAKQVLRALIANPPTPDQRTLPADAQLLAFYVLPDGTAIADFSDTLTSETPSGILSEQVAVDSIVQTLANNVSGLRRLKILIHGQEVDTLAGHVDLTGFFDLNLAVAAQTPPVVPTPSGASASSSTAPAGTTSAPNQSQPASPSTSTAPVKPSN
jgi:Sporulation and spore germination